MMTDITKTGIFIPPNDFVITYVGRTFMRQRCRVMAFDAVALAHGTRSNQIWQTMNGKQNQRAKK